MLLLYNLHFQCLIGRGSPHFEQVKRSFFAAYCFFLKSIVTNFHKHAEGICADLHHESAQRDNFENSAIRTDKESGVNYDGSESKGRYGVIGRLVV